MYWILQSNMYNEEGFKSLTEALDRLKLPYSTHKVIPFLKTLDPEPVVPEGPVIVMGSYTISNIAIEKGWKPGTFLDNLNYDIQRRNWGYHMLNHDAWICKLSDVPEQKNVFFIRPVDDSKSFVGQIMDGPSLVEWRKKILELTPEDNSTVTKDTLVMIATKKEIYKEYRTWIVDGKVVTSSLYKEGTRKYYSSQVDERIIHFAQGRAQIWSPNRAYVMDIAETPDGLKVVEINNLNSSGFYAANMGLLVAALEQAFGGIRNL